MNETVIKLIIGCIFGIFGKMIYDKIQDDKNKIKTINLLKIEIKSNLESLQKLLSEITYFNKNSDKNYLDRYSFEEVAIYIEKSCKKELLNKCLDKLPLLGSEKIEIIYNFYNAFEDTAKFMREYVRFGGNISVHFEENVLEGLIHQGEEALSAINK